ncbi:hypothetical protein CDEF62S_03320 [Castellaniella defragrans]
MQVGSPLLAGVLTVILGAILFAALGRNPLNLSTNFSSAP